MESKLSKKQCTICGSKLKKSAVAKGHTTCYKCHEMAKAMKNGDQAAKHRVDTAVKHMKQKPGVLKQIFSGIFNL